MKKEGTLELTLRGESFAFQSVKALSQWIGEEEQFWREVWGEKFHDRLDVRQSVLNAFSEVLASFSFDTSDTESLQTEIEEYYSLGNWLLLSESSDGQTVAAIANSAGDESSAFAYLVAAGRASFDDAANREEFRGAVLLSLPEFGKPSLLAKRLSSERENYRRDNRKQTEKTEEMLRAFDQRGNDYIKSMTSASSEHSRQLENKHNAAIKALEDSGETAVQSIKDVEDQYLKQMGLQAPVKYWTDKAKIHRTAEKEAGNRLAWFFPVALAVFGGAFYGAADFLTSHPEIKQAVYVIVGAGLASMGAVVFWIGRLFNRLYLSEHHLRLDAEERAVMTTTFLALINKEAANPEDKPIILNALFRQSSDGFIKDEGPSDVSIAAALSRLGMNKN